VTEALQAQQIHDASVTARRGRIHPYAFVSLKLFERQPRRAKPILASAIRAALTLTAGTSVNMGTAPAFNAALTASARALTKQTSRSA